MATHPARDAAGFRRIIAARQNLADAEQELRDAVHAARQVGDSWTVERRSTPPARPRSSDSATPDAQTAAGERPAASGQRP